LAAPKATRDNPPYPRCRAKHPKVIRDLFKEETMKPGILRILFLSSFVIFALFCKNQTHGRFHKFALPLKAKLR
jgi:hypothetical protein